MSRWSLRVLHYPRPMTRRTETTRVSVRFEPRDDGTEVIVIHERFASAGSRDAHLLGWEGCLLELSALLE